MLSTSSSVLLPFQISTSWEWPLIKTLLSLFRYLQCAFLYLHSFFCSEILRYILFLKNFIHLLKIFSPTLLTYNWYSTMYKFGAYTVVIWYMNTLGNDYHVRWVNTSITSRGYYSVCVCVCEHLRPTLLVNFKYTNTVLSTTDTKLHITSPECTHLTAVSWCLWQTSRRPSTPEPRQPAFYSLFLSIWLFQISCMREIIKYLSFSVWLTH